MAKIYPKAFFNDQIIDFQEANLSIASSAVLYGLSVYTVFHVAKTENGLLAFRLPEHIKRLEDSAKIIGIEPPAKFHAESFLSVAKELIKQNEITGDAFVRASIHVTENIPGTRSRGLQTALSMFVYEAEPIVPREGVRLKTSLWRRIPDIAIPSRAKVNGAYVNSVLARQDAIDSGYDDCIFLDQSGHVCELSAANIFLVRGDTLITPDTHTDLLEGINRRTIIELAREHDIPVSERSVDLTELYIADEVFISGTSAFISDVKEIDSRPINTGGPITEKLKALHDDILQGKSSRYDDWLTILD